MVNSQVEIAVKTGMSFYRPGRLSTPSIDLVSFDIPPRPVDNRHNGQTTHAMATTLPAPTLPRTDEGKRICQVIKVRPEHLDEYKRVRRAQN